MKYILNQLLLAYGRLLPYHPGKWRVVEGLVRAAGMEPWLRNRQPQVIRQGVSLALHPNCLVQRSLYYLGVYERNETNWFREQIRPGVVFFDIGSNFGYYALMASQASKDQATVHAFEPAPPLYDQLCINRELNGFQHLYPHRMALSDHTGEGQLIMPSEGNEGIGQLLPEAHAPGLTRPVETVALDTLDAFVAAQDLERVDLVKIDVEGAECRVLSGAEETLTRHRPRLLIEVNPAALEAFGTSAPALQAQLEAFGYSLWIPSRRGLTPLAKLPGPDEYVNAMALPA